MKRLRLFLILMCVSGAIMSLAEEKVSVDAYGYIKLDAIYETGRSSHGNFVMWAADPGESDGLFHVTSRETRLGMKIKGISFGKFKVTGKVEIDFYGSSAENKATNFMRHGYLKVSNGNFSITAGQTWDIISPLNPSTLNYPVLWGCGNIGYRRPQLSFRNDFKMKKSVISLQAGVFRTIGDGMFDGVAMGAPVFQGRLSGKFMVGGASFLQFGVSGHYGESKDTGGINYVSNSLNVDFLLVLSSNFKIIAEYFSGENLGTYFGGIVQGVNGDTEIRAKGFYVNLVGKLTNKTQISLGYGMDDPDNNDLVVGMRAKNTNLFGNLVFKFSPSFKVGVEIASVQTDYLDMDTQETMRIQNSWILTF
jgi:hypothetical protein